MTNRTAITTPLWVRLGIATITAALATLAAVSMSWGGLPPAAGKHLVGGALLVLPLVLAAKLEWSTPASVVFTYFVYFVLSMSVMFIFRRKN